MIIPTMLILLALLIDNDGFSQTPHRALYFTAYSQAKQMYNRVFSYESPVVHLCSAVSAGMCSVHWTCGLLFV